MIPRPITDADLAYWSWCLGHTEHGAPRHPLYVRSAEPLVRFHGSSA